MGRRCAVKNCKSGAIRENKSGPKLSIFSAPKDERMRNCWSHLLNQEIKEIDKICELHFNPSDVKKYYEVLSKDGTITKLPRLQYALFEGALPIHCNEIPTSNYPQESFTVANDYQREQIQEKLQDKKISKNLTIQMDHDCQKIIAATECTSYQTQLTCNETIMGVVGDHSSSIFNNGKVQQEEVAVAEPLEISDCLEQYRLDSINKIPSIKLLNNEGKEQKACEKAVSNPGYLKKQEMNDRAHSKCLENYPPWNDNCVLIKRQAFMNFRISLERHKRRNEELKQKISQLKREQKKLKNKSLEKSIERLPKIQQETIKACFLAASNGSGRYSLEWIQEIMQLYKNCKTAYIYLRKRNIIPLPSKSTLAKYDKILKNNSHIDSVNNFEMVPHETFYADKEDDSEEIFYEEAVSN